MCVHLYVYGVCIMYVCACVHACMCMMCVYVYNICEYTCVHVCMCMCMVCVCVGQRSSHMFSSITLHIVFSNPVCLYTHVEVRKQLGVLGVSFYVYEGYKVQVNSGHRACRARTFAH